MRDFRDAKAMARTLRQALAAKGVRLTNSEALELVARMLGARDWNTLAASIEAAGQAPPQATAPTAPTGEIPAPLSRVTFSPDLEKTLHRAVRAAEARAYTTLEDVLLALVEDSDAAKVLGACRIDVAKLSVDLRGWLSALELPPIEGQSGPAPTAGFHRVIQRAAAHVEDSGRPVVTGADILAAIFSEPESHAAFFLKQQGMSRYDAVSFIERGERKAGDEPRPSEATPPEPPGYPSVSGSASFTAALERSLHQAVGLAKERRHEYATLEHLLLALLDNAEAAEVLSACAVDIEALRAGLGHIVDHDYDRLVTGAEALAKPTAGFHRVIQRAVVHVRSSGRSAVTGANVLVAIFSERESGAAQQLTDQGLTRYDAVNFIAHGVRKDGGRAA